MNYEQELELAMQEQAGLRAMLMHNPKPCECGVMTDEQCGHMPARHCGLWEECGDAHEPDHLAVEREAVADDEVKL